MPPVLTINRFRFEVLRSNICQGLSATVDTATAVMKISENDAPMPR